MGSLIGVEDPTNNRNSNGLNKATPDVVGAGDITPPELFGKFWWMRLKIQILPAAGTPNSRWASLDPTLLDEVFSATFAERDYPFPKNNVVCILREPRKHMIDTHGFCLKQLGHLADASDRPIMLC